MRGSIIVRLPPVLALFAVVACGAGARGAGGPVDRALVGAWRGSGTVMTASVQRSGSFVLRIAEDGAYVLVSSDGPDFVVDTGHFTEGRAGGYVRRMSSGLEDRGRYEVEGDRLRFTSVYGELKATRAATGEGEPGLTRVATLARLPTRNHISQWTARAAQYAQLWQADARLEYVSLAGFDDRGLLLPQTSATIGFYSPSVDGFLLLSPRGDTGAMVMSTSPRGGREVGPRAIPVPIIDLAMLVNRQRAAGQAVRYSTATLRFVTTGGAPPRLLWMAATADSTGLDRHCLDAATGEVVDCRRVAGDPRADLEALERRAVAAWTAMQQRLSAGDASSGDFSYVPPSDFERCGLRGGSHNGVGCFGGDGAEIRVY